MSQQSGHAANGASFSDTVDIQGVSWPATVSQEALNAIKHFDVRDDDVWIATWPKAGTHWVSEICALVLHDGELALIDRDKIPSPLEFEVSRNTVRDFGPGAVARYKEAPGWKSPRVLVTHVPRGFLPDQLLAMKKGKVIVVIRNPKDSLLSGYHFVKDRLGLNFKFDELLQKYVYSDKVWFGSWFDHVLQYWAARHKKQYLVLKYEDMKADTRGAVVQIADHLGRLLSDEVIDKITDLVSVKQMKTRFHTAGEMPTSYTEGKMAKLGPPNVIRKGIVGDWKTIFTVAQSEAFDELYRQKMAGSGLILEFE